MSNVNTLIEKWKELDRLNDGNKPHIEERMKEITVELALMGYSPQKLASVRPINKVEYVSQYSKQLKESKTIGVKLNLTA